jgi:hypothetical protein
MNWIGLLRRYLKSHIKLFSVDVEVEGLSQSSVVFNRGSQFLFIFWLDSIEGESTTIRAGIF